MNTKYREYSMEPREFHAMLILGEEWHGHLEVCALANEAIKGDYDKYHDWIQMWKSHYNQLSEVIHFIKAGDDLVQDLVQDYTQQERHLTLNSLRILANTMLNARQYAKDRRRGLNKKAR